MNTNKLSLLLLCILMSATSAIAQTQPNLENGYTAYGSYDGSNIDTVNLQNGNLMLHIPMPFSYPQRGGRLTSTNVLSLSSKAWSIQTDIGSSGQVSYHWTLGGFSREVNIGKIGTGIGFANTMDLAVHRTVTNEIDSFGGTTSYSGYYLTTWDGSTHKLMETGPADPNGNVTLFDAGDASGYRVNLNAVCTANGQLGCGVVIDRDGNRYEFDSWQQACGKWVTNNGLAGNTSTQICQGASIIARIIDANGNLIDTQDTMGRMRSGLTAAQPSDTSGCVAPDPSTPIASATIQTYQGYNGVTNQIKVCKANITLQTFFGVSGVTEFQNSSEANPTNGHPALSVIVTVLLLDGDTWANSSRWTFSYDSYGNITRLGLPTGGSITYGWSLFNPNSNCIGISKMTRVVSTRTIDDNNGHTFRWTYGYVAPTSLGAPFANTVTDPLNNDTLHYFFAQDNACTYYEQTTQYFQGVANSGTPKKQVDMTYARPSSVVNEATAQTYVPITIKTTMDNGRVSQVTKTYDSGPGNNRPSFGNVLTESAYDFGFWSPGPLVREVDTTYQWQIDTTGAYETAHLLDIPASVVTKAAGGCAVAETDYAYDEGGDAALRASGIGDTQHHIAAPTPNIRGNTTSVTKWLITGGSSGTCGAKSSSITSKATLYDTGLLYQAIDPLNHASTHYFDPAYLGAYATQTCDALNHCVSGTYDLTTGLLTSFTNQNGTMAVGNTQGDAAHTTLYSYDSFSRIKVASMPDGGQVSFNYSLPNTFPISVEKVRKINAALDDHSFAYLDGLGRGFKTLHRTPDGDVTALSTYDGFDRTINATNPYISTSDPTYGVIQTQYDALGQPTQTTKQDGSTATALYNQSASVSNGNCTTTTDEAGKQRRTCVDGLGRLIEVDEPGDNFGGAVATGTLTVNGTLLTKSGIGASGGSKAQATITISGVNHVLPGGRPVKCPPRTICDNDPQPPYYDNGKVYITVNGHEYDYFFGASGTAPDSATSVAQGLVNVIQSDTNRVVDASVPTGTTQVLLAAKTVGQAGNSIGFKTGYTWDSADFPTQGASFTAAPATGNLANGTDPTGGATVTDSGTTNATVKNQAGTIIFTTASVPYGGSSPNGDGAHVAAALATAFNVPGSPVSASANGASLSLTYNSIGVAGNVNVTITSTSSQSTYFPNGSFSGATNLSNGADPAPPSLDHPFVTLYSYDTLNNLTCVVQKGSDTSAFTTCAAAPAAWRPRSFTYDSLSRLLTATNPESGTISYTYDLAGNVLQKTSPAANQTGSAVTTISACYDALNRPTGRAYSAQVCQNGQLPAGTAAITYSYDAGTNGLGQLSSVIDQAGSASYTYDALGRLTAEQRTTNGISKSVSYEYNLDSSVKVIHYPSGAAITYTPDSAGRTLSATDIANGINYVTGATYGPDNSITGFVNGNNGTFIGIANAFSYNKRLQPVNISATTPSQQKVFAIGYDFHVGNGTTGSDNGNVWGITNFKDSSRSESFTYDALNRLASAQTAGTDCTATLVDGHTKNWGDSYAYDAWGNLLSKTPTKCGGENIAGTMNTKNQPLGYTAGATSTFNYSFDAAGNLRNDGVLTYNYDAENRITGANGFTYTYDADGNRVKKSNGTTGTIYWYAAVGVIAETDLAGNNAKEYIFFNGNRVARKDSNGQVFYYFSDHLKTTAVITDSVGNIKSESDFDPWGVERRVVDSFNNAYKFTGKERDPETGFDYFGARYYGSNIGRFVTPDWAAKAVAVPYADYGNPQSLNLYSYVKNNPTTLVDDDGHEDKNQKQNVKPTQSGPKKKEEKKQPPRVNVGSGLNQVWQQRPDPGPSGKSNQGNSNQGGSNQGNSNQGNSNQGNANQVNPNGPIVIDPVTGHDQNGVCYPPPPPREVVEKCDPWGCYKVYKDTGEALPHQNRMPSGEPLENAGDGWAHLAWIRSQETHSNEQEHNPDQEQKVPLPQNWRDMPIRWPEKWEKMPPP